MLYKLFIFQLAELFWWMVGMARALEEEPIIMTVNCTIIQRIVNLILFVVHLISICLKYSMLLYVGKNVKK